MILSDVLATIFAVLLLAVAFVAGYFVLATRRIAADAERRVPPAGSFVTIDGNRIHYVEAGQGPPILFLHGLGGQLLHFRATLFDELSRDFRVIALDRPGSGYSTRASGASGGCPNRPRSSTPSSRRSGWRSRWWSAIRSAVPWRWRWRSATPRRYRAWRCWRR